MRAIERVHPRSCTSSLAPKPGGVEKSPFEIAAKRLEVDHMCQYGANRNTWAGYRMGTSPRTQTAGSWDRKSATTVGSSSGLITIVVMTLLFNIAKLAVLKPVVVSV